MQAGAQSSAHDPCEIHVLLARAQHFTLSSYCCCAADPTYMIRAIPTTSTDRIYCKILAHNSVHAAFAGAGSRLHCVVLPST